jgi:uncharacterized membrane protein YfcA
MTDIVYASIVITCASFSQSITGIGFVMLATPFLLEILNVRDTVIITFALAVISQLMIISKHWRSVHPQMFVNFVLGSAFGAPFGLWFFSIASHAALKLTIGLVLFLISLFSIWNVRRQWRVMDTIVSYQYSSKTPPIWCVSELLRGVGEGDSKIQLLAGIIAGFFGPSIGMPGIPLIVYFSAVNMDKEAARSTTLAFFIVICIVTLVANYGLGTISPKVYEMAPLLVPSLLIGMVLGIFVFPRIPQRWFQLILNLIILYSSCRMLSDYI